jgi:two-component system, chemotaxis family, chemotaxis protein CheY
MKLLIVDDSNIMRRAIEKYLGTFNLEIVGSAGDGERALEIFTETMPDLVTLDITMPKMDGLSCLEKMIEIKPDTKIIIISALKDPATGIQALKKGAKGFLSKPFKQEDLIEEMKACIEE